MLVVDDERQILRALRIILRDAGFEVATAATADEALDALAVRPPDAAILDLVLPDGNGVDICRSIREWSEMPVIVLSAVGEEAEKVRALEAGADDYVTKPFGPDELIARLRAALRRARPGARDEPVLRAPGLELDLAAHRVSVDGSEVHLTPTEYELLRVLMQQRGRLMTHRPLLTEVWGPGYEDDTQVLRVHVANLGARSRPSPGAALRAHRSGSRLPLRRLSRRLHDIFRRAGASSRGLHGAGPMLVHMDVVAILIGLAGLRLDVPRARGARPGMSAAELFGLVVSLAVFALSPLRAPAR